MCECVSVCVCVCVCVCTCVHVFLLEHDFIFAILIFSVVLDAVYEHIVHIGDVWTCATALYILHIEFTIYNTHA